MRGRLQELDTDGSGTLDRGKIKVLLRMIGNPDDEESVDDMLTEMWQGGGEQGTVGQVSLPEFLAWWRKNFPTKGKRSRASGVTKALSSVGSKVKSSSKAIGEAAGMEQKKEKARGIAPESIFVMDQTGNAEARETHEAAILIQEQFESDFKHLEDIMLSSLDTGWLELWEEAMVEHWDQQEKDEVLAQLDEVWTDECIDAASTGIDLAQGSVAALHRGFLRSQIPETEVSAGKFSRMRGRKKDKPLTPAAARQNAKQFAAENLADGARDLEQLLDCELLPLRAAVEAVCQAVQLEVEQRETKIKSLATKLTRMGADTPRKVQVSGLRGAAAEANGVYIADGLKSFWNRPLYVQMPEHHDVSNLHYLYFDMAYTTTQDLQQGSWGDATWIIGPTLNSDRCTAYFDEPMGTELLYPMPSNKLENSASAWMVFDVVNHKWAAAPGGHCPSFSVNPILDGEDTMANYIGAAIADQEQIVEEVKAKLDSSTSADDRETDQPATRPLANESFEDMVERSLGELSADDCIARKDFLSWRNQFYMDELEGVKERLRGMILDRSSGVKFPSENDFNDNQDFVENILDEYVVTFGMKQQTRRVAQRKFVANANKPVLSRAFFSCESQCLDHCAKQLCETGY